MSTNNICFRGEIKKKYMCLPDTHSYLDLCKTMCKIIYVLAMFVLAILHTKMNYLDFLLLFFFLYILDFGIYL